MGRVRAELQLPGVAPSDAEELWYDTRRWPTFVDGLGHVFKVDEGWPREPGAVAIWDSKPGGRGRVLERVVSFEARVGQTVEVEDEKIHGRQTIGFQPNPDGTIVTLELDYAIKQDRGVPAVVDFVFVRRPMRDSLKRTLARFEREVRAPADL
jgi:Polyketide cyclase / dehydrase and lipid transport